jgi:hypothetical protein
MKVHVAWDLSSFKNVDLVAIQSFDAAKYDIFLKNLSKIELNR